MRVEGRAGRISIPLPKLFKYSGSRTVGTQVQKLVFRLLGVGFRFERPRGSGFKFQGKGVQGSRYRVQISGASGFRVQEAGFRGQGAGFRVQGSGGRGPGSGVRVQGSGCMVRGSGVRGQGSGVRGQGSGVGQTLVYMLSAVFSLCSLGGGGRHGARGRVRRVREGGHQRCARQKGRGYSSGTDSRGCRG